MASPAVAGKDSNPFAIELVGPWDVLSKVPDSIFAPLLPEASLLKLEALDETSSESASHLDLPELQTFDDEPLLELDDIPVLSASSSDIGYCDSLEDLGEDIWRLDHHGDDGVDDNIRYNINDESSLIDQGPNPAFSDDLELDTNILKEYKAPLIPRRDEVVNCLWSLGLGRPSPMYTLNSDESAFTESAQKLSSTYQSQLDRRIVQGFLTLGNGVLAIRNFAKIIQGAKQRFGIARHLDVSGMANVATTFIAVIEDYFVSHQNGNLNHLHIICDHIGEPVNVIKNILTICTSSSSNSTTAMLASTFIQDQPYDNAAIHDIVIHVFARITQPWLENLEHMIGLNAGVYLPSNNFLEADGASTLGTAADVTGAIPDFVTQDLKDLTEECSRCFTFMQVYQPDHPLCHSSSLHNAPRIEWRITEEDANRSVHAVKEYERSMREASVTFETGTIKDEGPNHSYWWKAELLSYNQDVERNGCTSTTDPDTSVLLPDHEHDSLREVMQQYLHGTHEPLDPVRLEGLVDLSLAPILRAQHSLLTRAVVSSVFRQHAFLDNLALHHAFHLCSSGAFTSRLADTLLQSEYNHRNKLTSVTSNTDLRLVLANVCESSWKEINPTRSSRRTIPGDLTLTLPAIVSTLNKNPFAISHLQLAYTPPPQLASIFTPKAEGMYASIFRQLLRVHYAQWSLGQILRKDTLLPPQSRTDVQDRVLHAFRLHAQHVLSIILYHFHTVGIESAWQSFMHYVQAAKSFSQSDDPRGNGSGYTPTAISHKHMATLQNISQALLLDDDQRKAKEALRRVCEGVLDFVGQARYSTRDLSKLYGVWSGQLENFVERCRDLVEGPKGLGNENLGCLKGLVAALGGVESGEEDGTYHVVDEGELKDDEWLE